MKLQSPASYLMLEEPAKSAPHRALHKNSMTRNLTHLPNFSCPGWSDIQSNRSHQCQPVALRDYTVSQFVIERHTPVLEFLLKVDVAQLTI